MEHRQMATRSRAITMVILVGALWALAGCERPMDGEATPAWMTSTTASLETELVQMHGEAVRSAAHRGLHQVASFWRVQDGDEPAFREFVQRNFAATDSVRDALFARSQVLLEQLDGHMLEVIRELRMQTDLDRGPILPFDEIMAAYDPSAHVSEDLFANKFAFVVLLNFPLTTLEERLEQGVHWTRRQWAEARLAQRFSRRLPAEVNRAIAEAGAETDQYIAEYNIWMHHLVDEQGGRLFPAGLRLLSHWNLRDELKANYNDREHGRAKQATDPKSHGADHPAGDSRRGGKQPVRGLEPHDKHRHCCRRQRRPGSVPCRADDYRPARAGYALCDAAEDVHGLAHG